MAKKLLNMKVLKTAVRVLFFLSIACFSSGLMMTKDNQWEIGGSKDPYDNGGYYGDSQGGGADIGAPSSAGVVYELSADGSYALVISYTGNATHVGVDATYQGKPVTTIYKDAFYNNDTIVAVTLPEGVTTIHNAAFNGCWRLTTINLPASVTDIGPSAFPSELLTSYNNCLYMGASGNPYFALIETESQNYSSYTIHPNTKIIAEQAFSGCERLQSVTVPGSVTHIGNSAFASLENLQSVTISNGVTHIGDYAFGWCQNLESVTISNGVTHIGNGAFNSCQNLESVTIPGSVTHIGAEAFGWCQNLESVTISNGVTHIGDMAFYCCSKLQSVTIPGSVTHIGAEAFAVTNDLNVKYRGSEAQWNAIVKGENWAEDDTTVTYNYTGS